MDTEERQTIIFEGTTYSRIVRMVIYSSTGCSGKVDLNGSRYDVLEDIATKTWQVIGRDNSYRKRARIPTAIRRAIYERDNYMCLMCGSLDRLALDHIEPHIDGGSSEPANLQTLCHSCNAAKSNFTYFGSNLRHTSGKPWYPISERNLASRLIQTLLRHGYTYQRIAEETDIPQQSVTRLAKRAQGTYESVKKIERLSVQVIPGLKLLAIYLVSILSSF